MVENYVEFRWKYHIFVSLIQLFFLSRCTEMIMQYSYNQLRNLYTNCYRLYPYQYVLISVLRHYIGDTAAGSLDRGAQLTSVCDVWLYKLFRGIPICLACPDSASEL